jgi:hypothetical protein
MWSRMSSWVSFPLFAALLLSAHPGLAAPPPRHDFQLQSPRELRARGEELWRSGAITTGVGLAIAAVGGALLAYTLTRPESTCRAGADISCDIGASSGNAADPLLDVVILGAGGLTAFIGGCIWASGAVKLRQARWAESIAGATPFVAPLPSGGAVAGLRLLTF